MYLIFGEQKMVGQSQPITQVKTQIIESVKYAIHKAIEEIEDAMKTGEITINTTYSSEKDVKDNIVSMMLDLKSALNYLDSAKRLIQELEG